MHTDRKLPSSVSSPYSSINEKNPQLDNLASRVNDLRPSQFDLSSPDVKARLLDHLDLEYAELCKLVPQNGVPLSSQMKAIAGTIFYLYGRCCYGGDMVASKQPLILALGLMLKHPRELVQDEASDVLRTVLTSHKTLFKAADALGTSQAQGSDVAQRVLAIGEKLNQVDQTILTNLVNAMDPPSAFEAALAFRWLGATWHNLDGTNQDHDRLKKVYDVAEAVARHLMDHNPREDHYDLWLVADIIYNTRRGLHAMKNGQEDVLGQLATLEELQTFLSAYPETPKKGELEAQTHNIKGVLLRDFNDYSTSSTDAKRNALLDQYGKTALERLRIRYKEVVQASECADQTPGFNPFLQIMFANNKLTLGLLLKKTDPSFELAVEAAIAWHERVTKTIEAVDYPHADDATIKTKGHYYHAVFCQTAAKYEAVYGNPDGVKKWLELGVLICQKFPQSATKTFNEIEDLIKTNSENARVQLLFRVLKFPGSLLFGLSGEYSIFGTRICFMKDTRLMSTLEQKIKQPILRLIPWIALRAGAAIRNLNFNASVEAGASLLARRLFDRSPVTHVVITTPTFSWVGASSQLPRTITEQTRLGQWMGADRVSMAHEWTTGLLLQISLLAQMRLLTAFAQSRLAKWRFVGQSVQSVLILGVISRFIADWKSHLGWHLEKPHFRQTGLLRTIEQKVGKPAAVAALVTLAVPAILTTTKLVSHFARKN